MSTSKFELIAQLTESHVRFVDAIINNDGKLALLAYRNYIQALSKVLIMTTEKEACT